jgi:hypothetical protein
MASQNRTRQEIVELLGRAAVQAQHAEEYHAAVGGPGRVEGKAARQAACDAAAMQLIELAGYADGFGHDRGEPGTTLARFDDALRPVIVLRHMHTHPEMHMVPPAVTPRGLGELVRHLKSALRNLDSETLRVLAPKDMQILNGLARGLGQIEKDGMANAAALRPRDLHYAGYYREIQFARLVKETGLFDLEAGSPGNALRNDIRGSISTGDKMAHTFHEMRGPDMRELPASVVAPDRPNAVPGRPVSELIRELRRESQSGLERVSETQIAAKAQAQELYRGAVDGLAQDYMRITGDAKAAAPVLAYAARQVPPLDLETIAAMREGLRVAADPAGDYRRLAESVQKACLQLYFGLEEEGDRRLIDILDRADARSGRTAAEKVYEHYPGLTVDDNEGREGVKGQELDADRDFSEKRGPGRGR